MNRKFFFEKFLEFVGIFWWIWFIPSTNSTSLLYRLGPKHTYRYIRNIFQHETLLYDYAKICTAVIHIRVILSKFSLYWKRIHSCFLFTLWASIIMMRLSFSPSHYGPFMIHIWSPKFFSTQTQSVRIWSWKGIAIMVVLVMGGGKSLMTLISTPFISLVLDSSKGRGRSNGRPSHSGLITGNSAS